MRTSKIALLGWTALGVWLLLNGELGSEKLAIYLAVLGVLVWNRIDSRKRGYRVSLSGLGGAKMSVEVGGGVVSGELEDGVDGGDGVGVGGDVVDESGVEGGEGEIRK
jgi:hypothetical protein